MLDDASRTRRTDVPPTPRLTDYVIITALLAIASIASYQAFDDGSTGPVAEAAAEATGTPGASVVR